MNLVGLQAGAGKDRVRALEAERELLELKLALARQALSDIYRVTQPLQVIPGSTYDIIRTEADEALEVIGRAE